MSQRRHPPTPVPLSLDASGITSGYSNLVQVTGTAEEVILDIGLDRPAIGKNPAEAIAPGGRRFDQRIVLSFPTAKRLFRAIQAAVQRHEALFGPLETDVRRRLKR